MNKSMKAIVVLLMAAALMLSACSKTNNGGGAAPSGTAAAGSGETASSIPTPEETAVDPNAKYDPPITISVNRQNGNWKFPAGQSIDDNDWYRFFEQEYGVKIKNAWISDTAEQEKHKMSVAMISGELPDIFTASANDFSKLVEGDQLADLTEAFDKYASPTLKKLAEEYPNAIKTGTIDGKLMGFPVNLGSLDGLNMMWIRTDWLKKLGLPEPKTMQDVLSISEAFTKRDPDGNNVADTIGISSENTIYGSIWSMLSPLFNGYHAYPTMWVKDGDGKLVYGSIQPEMKTVLAQLQQMYKDGQLDREFTVKDTTKAAELIASGKVGIQFGPQWNPFAPLLPNVQNDPNAEWQVFPIPSIDDRPAAPQVTLGTTAYYTVKKGFANPEALIKMINVFIDIKYDGTKEQLEKLVNIPQADGTIIEAFKWHPFQFDDPNHLNTLHKNIVAALNANDTSKLNADEVSVYNQIKAFMDGDRNQWPMYAIHSPEIGSSYEVLGEYFDKKRPYMANAFYGVDTPAMVDYKATLDKLESETITKIVMGSAPIDQFDKFVAEWKKLGGDQITAEVNEWAAKFNPN